MSDLFPGFALERRRVNGVTINLRHGGSGPPLLLMHGFPQTHAIWHRVATPLARRFSLVMPDLRGQSVRDVARMCAQLGLRLEARGEGFAARQDPAPGAEIDSGQTVRVDFARRN